MNSKKIFGNFVLKKLGGKKMKQMRVAIKTIFYFCVKYFL